MPAAAASVSPGVGLLCAAGWWGQPQVLPSRNIRYRNRCRPLHLLILQVSRRPEESGFLSLCQQGTSAPNQGIQQPLTAASVIAPEPAAPNTLSSKVYGSLFLTITCSFSSLALTAFCPSLFSLQSHSTLVLHWLLSQTLWMPLFFFQQ